MESIYGKKRYNESKHHKPFVILHLCELNVKLFQIISLSGIFVSQHSASQR